MCSSDATSSVAEPRGSAPALTRGLAILEAVAAQAQGAGFSELRAALQIPGASLARMLNILHARGFLSRRASGAWQLGAALVRLGSVAAARNDLITVAQPILHTLRRSVEETVELSIPADPGLLLVQKLESERSIRLFIQPGTQYHALHAIASGKVMLAFGESDQRERLLARGRFKRLTRRTLTSAARLREEFRRALVHGFAADVEESRPGVARIAAPVFDVDHRLAAVLAVAGPVQRMAPRGRPRHIEAVRAAAWELSRALGASRVPQPAEAGLVLPSGFLNPPSGAPGANDSSETSARRSTGRSHRGQPYSTPRRSRPA